MAELANDLQLLANKAFSQFNDDREQLALDYFLALLDHLGLCVRQRLPKSMNEALSHRLEMEAQILLKKVSMCCAKSEVSAANISLDDDL